MTGLSLFTGSGIGELAFKNIFPGYRTIGYVEIDRYCRSIIRARIRDGILDDAPVFDDIREFNRRYASLYAGKVDWLSGGFPCQPFSVAGRQLGEADERNMWPETRNAISLIRPQHCLLENVPGLLANEYIRRVFGDLAEIGYDCEWDVVGASDVGANHRRRRLWILAHNQCGRRGENWLKGGMVAMAERKEDDSIQTTELGADVADTERLRELQSQGSEQDERGWVGDNGEAVADTGNARLERQREITGGVTKKLNNPGDGGWWSVEPNVGRVANGVASRVDRLKCLGNGWVPQVVRRILEITQH